MDAYIKFLGEEVDALQHQRLINDISMKMPDLSIIAKSKLLIEKGGLVGQLDTINLLIDKYKSLPDTYEGY